MGPSPFGGPSHPGPSLRATRPARLASLDADATFTAGISWAREELAEPLIAGWAGRTYSEGHIGVTTCL